MYYTYVLQSEIDNKFYVGYTKDLKLRFERHSKGYIESTQNRRPLKLIYYEACLTQQDALRREKYLKTWHGKQYLHKRLKSYLMGWMGNHFHLLIQMFPEHNFKDEEIRKRCKAHYGEDFEVSDEQIADYRVKLSSLANYMKEIKQAFSWYYNQRHNRRGTLWGERFKSVIVEKGETLINCLAYIDLNPLRAGIVNRPENYRWNSLSYHIQTNNQDNFLSTDFGPGEMCSAVTSELHGAGPGEIRSLISGVGPH